MGMSCAQRRSATIGLLLVLVYVLPLFMPPSAAWPAQPQPEWGLWERIFTEVPSWWVLGRLACLFAGTGLIVLSIRDHLPLQLPSVTAGVLKEGAPPVSVRAAQLTALLLALGQALAAFWVARFDRRAETVYFLFLAAPAAVLALTETAFLRRALRSLVSQLPMLLVVPAVWIAWYAASAWRSPRAASVVDGWLAVERFAHVAGGIQRVWSDSGTPGFTNAYMLLLGVPLFGPGKLSVTFTALQLVQLGWIVVSAVGIGVVVRKMVGKAPALVAQAAFLFSPFLLSFFYDPLPIFLNPLGTVVLLLLVLAVRESGSAAFLAAFGAVAGFSATNPPVVSMVVLLCFFMAYSVSRLPRIPWIAAATAALSCIAARLPGFPDLETLAAMTHRYTTGRGQLSSMVLILLGQDSPGGTMDALSAGRPGLLDIPVGALLSPFAIARTPMRLWGDTLFDPLGTTLMAIGLGLCVLYVRQRASLFVLALLAAGWAPAFISGSDAVSHTRLSPALPAFALLAATGFEALRRTLVPTWRPRVAAACTAATIAGTGIAIFDGVNPRILPASWLATSLEAIGTSEPRADAVFLQHDGTWDVTTLHGSRIAALVPARPFPTRTFGEFERMQATAEDTSQSVYFWSPGLERDAAVSRAICDRWPAAALYTLLDRPGLFRAFAAAPRRDVWQPDLPPKRWTVSSCDALPAGRP
jgi:hypothetical protein